MKLSQLIIAFSIALCLSACTKGEVSITLTNTLPIERSEEPIVLSREFIASQVGEIPVGKFPILLDSDVLIPQQLDDLDQNGIWDELAALVKIGPSATKQLQISLVDSLPNFKKRTSVYLGVDYTRSDQFKEVSKENRHPENIANKYPMMYQMEGPAWENDKVGFRLYFDSRNGKDIFGKTTQEMTLKLAGINDQDYHTLDKWGMDILKVGNSLGAGSVALIYQDSLFRLGNTETSSFQILTEGPVRSIFDLKHEGWSTPLGSLKITERIGIWAGQYAFFEELIVDNDVACELAVGMVNKYNKVMNQKKVGNSQYIATYAEQTENHDLLGIGLIVPQSTYAGVGEVGETEQGIGQTYYFKINASPETKVSYYFVSGWELSDDQFSTKNGFINYLEDLSLRVNAPLLID